jgi:hypothetical protein
VTKEDEDILHNAKVLWQFEVKNGETTLGLRDWFTSRERLKRLETSITKARKGMAAACSANDYTAALMTLVEARAGRAKDELVARMLSEAEYLNMSARAIVDELKGVSISPMRELPE